MNGLGHFLVSTSTVTVLSLIIAWCRKKDARKIAKVLSSSDDSWKKVGKVKALWCYPLKSGRGKQVEKCNFQEYGISINEPGTFSMKDRMFMVYDEKTGKFKTGRDIPKLLLVSINPVDNNRAKLEAQDKPELIFNIPKLTSEDETVTECLMWWDETIKGLDCGTEPAKWLSEYLLGSNSGLKLAICLPNKRRSVTKGVWEKYAKVYNTLRDEDTGLFSDLASYMVMSESSVQDLNDRLEKPISLLQLRPNIVVEDCEPFAEDQWEWIKIGTEAIIRNFKRCTRCSMVRIDPFTGIPDPSLEPLKTLRTYRKLKDVEISALENHAPAIGIYCGLYRTGSVNVGDDIYIYQN